MLTSPDGPGSERDQARFHAKVALPNEQGCMLWLGSLFPDGYGQFRVGGRTGRLVRAHRFAYTLAYGEIPEGLVIDHVRARGCTNRHCVAPEHLEAVTRGENNRRGGGAAFQRAKTRCPQGHPYDEVNTYVDSRGSRNCRVCARIHHRALYRRRKAC